MWTSDDPRSMCGSDRTTLEQAGMDSWPLKFFSCVFEQGLLGVGRGRCERGVAAQCARMHRGSDTLRPVTASNPHRR
jgi:hypothetical protein